jgi:hypothetical protein
MKVLYKVWIERMRNWANLINSSNKLSSNPPIGNNGNYYTFEIEYSHEKFKPIKISQNAVGTDIEVNLSYLIFETIDKQLYNYNLSIYQKGFFERLFNLGRIKTGNSDFDKKFGIYTSDKVIALKLFSDAKVQDLFLNNKFLILNIQKNKSIITLKNMETKLYEIQELNKLLEDYIYILNLLNND